MMSDFDCLSSQHSGQFLRERGDLCKSQNECEQYSVKLWIQDFTLFDRFKL